MRSLRVAVPLASTLSCRPRLEVLEPEAARVLLERFRVEYNTEHLHSSLGYMTPSEYAEAHAVGAA